MEMRIRTFLDDKINTLNRNAVDTSPARQIFRTASAILALIRVSALALVSFVDSDWRPNQDTGLATKTLSSFPNTVSTYVRRSRSRFKGRT